MSKYPLHKLEEKSDAYLNSRHKKNWLLTKNVKERRFLLPYIEYLLANMQFDEL